MAAITLHLGQPIEWPAAPLGIAQVDELRRVNVRILYACKTGRILRPIVHPSDIARHQGRLPQPPLFAAIENPFNCGILHRKEKTYTIEDL
jgi:hypothetical protein